MTSENFDDQYVLISEPLNPMLNMALEAHRLLSSYIKAGFTRTEAFDLLLNQMPEWNFPSPSIMEPDEESEEDEDDDELWEESPDEMTEDDRD